MPVGVLRTVITLHKVTALEYDTPRCHRAYLNSCPFSRCHLAFVVPVHGARPMVGLIVKNTLKVYNEYCVSLTWSGFDYNFSLVTRYPIFSKRGKKT